MIWVLLAVVALGLVLERQRTRRFKLHWEHLSQMVADLAKGSRPRSFVFHLAPDFTRLALELEKVHEEQKLLREQVSAGQYNLQMVLASMTEGVVVVDGERRIRLVNQAFLRLLELKADPTGKTVLSGLRNGEIDALLRLTLETGAPQTREISFRSMLAAGDRYFEVNATPVHTPQGSSDVVAVFHDISRLRRLEEVRREFVANVSHELKTPLSIFQGYLETLEDPALPPAQIAEMVAILKRHSHRLSAILEDLLSLARLEARTEKLEVVEVDLPTFVGQLVQEWQPRCDAKQVALACKVETPVLKADPLRLQQVLVNLLQNAIKYTESGGAITIRAFAENGQTAVAVEDTGIGIPPADLPHIFERFYRVEKGRSRETGGTGLGLSIVKHILALHGGTAEAASEHGKGTTITVRFPCRK